MTIGFEQTTYETTEGVTAKACVVVLSDILEKTVVVTVFSSDDTATGTCTINGRYTTVCIAVYRDAHTNLCQPLGYKNYKCFAKFISNSTNQCVNEWNLNSMCCSLDFLKQLFMHSLHKFPCGMTWYYAYFMYIPSVIILILWIWFIINSWNWICCVKLDLRLQKNNNMWKHERHAFAS